MLQEVLQYKLIQNLEADLLLQARRSHAVRNTLSYLLID